MAKKVVIFDDNCNACDLQKTVVLLSQHDFEFYAAASPGWIFSWMQRNGIFIVEKRDAIDVAKFLHTILGELGTEQFTEPLVIILGQPKQNRTGFELNQILRFLAMQMQKSELYIVQDLQDIERVAQLDTLPNATRENIRRELSAKVLLAAAKVSYAP